ncbi:MAG: DnaJ domain-containing protein, partial [Polyangiaceae bacterium]
EDYFTMLGVPRDASTDAVRAAFFALAKQWHPDRVPSVLADAKEACARVFSKMSEAYQTLVDPEKREKYAELIASGGTVKTAEQETIVKVVEAATLFQKAEIMFKRNDLTGAEALVRRANELDPKQAEYLALLTWIEATRPGAMADSQTLHFIDALSQAIAKNENCERAYFYRAMLYKRMGNTGAAMRDFRTVVEQNPRNVDAQRELRLHNMRGGKPQTQPGREPTQRARNDSQPGRDPHPHREEAKGLFAGFFNKKK